MKMFFDHITNMKNYNGFEANPIGGGRYVDQEGYGHELYNFSIDNGKCYGYTAPLCKVNLERISKDDISEDTSGRYLDGVLVIFTCEGKNGKRVIAGFYKNARVYEEAVDDDRSFRFYEKENRYICYNLKCNSDNAVLISQDDRNFEIPYSKTSVSGHGQHNIWYADKDIDSSTRSNVMQYVDGIIAESELSDERKYFYNENKKRVVSTHQIARSREARDKCIELKGCRCGICEFDFKRTYGDLGKDYIEVHHITSIGTLTSTIGYEGTDPEKDLIPLCSNCHSMVHRRNPAYHPDEIKAILKAT